MCIHNYELADNINDLQHDTMFYVKRCVPFL